MDLIKICTVVSNVTMFNNLVSRMCKYFYKHGALLGVRSQLACQAATIWAREHASLLRREGWEGLLHCILTLWGLGMLPPLMVELDDFTDSEGKELPGVCATGLVPPGVTAYCLEGRDDRLKTKEKKEEEAGFLAVLSGYFESSDDDVSDDEMTTDGKAACEQPVALYDILQASAGIKEPLSLEEVAAKLKGLLAKERIHDIFSLEKLRHLSQESMNGLTEALMEIAQVVPRPVQDIYVGEAPQLWHQKVDPIFGLEILVGASLASIGKPEFKNYDIIEKVVSHFSALLQQMSASQTPRKTRTPAASLELRERLVVDCLKLAIRISNTGNEQFIPRFVVPILKALCGVFRELLLEQSDRISLGVLVLLRQIQTVASPGIQRDLMPPLLSLVNRLSTEGQLSAVSASAVMESVVLLMDRESPLAKYHRSDEVHIVLLSTLQGLACHDVTSESALAYLQGVAWSFAEEGEGDVMWAAVIKSVSGVAVHAKGLAVHNRAQMALRQLLEGSGDSRQREKMLSQISFPRWKECFDCVLLPLLDGKCESHRGSGLGQILCRAVLAHKEMWSLKLAPGGEGAHLILRIVKGVVDSAVKTSAELLMETETGDLSPSSARTAVDQYVQALRNLLMVCAMDGQFRLVQIPGSISKAGGPALPNRYLFDCMWEAVSRPFPDAVAGIHEMLATQAMRETIDTDTSESPPHEDESMVNENKADSVVPDPELHPH